MVNHCTTMIHTFMVHTFMLHHGTYILVRSALRREKRRYCCVHTSDSSRIMSLFRLQQTACVYRPGMEAMPRSSSPLFRYRITRLWVLFTLWCRHDCVVLFIKCRRVFGSLDTRTTAHTIRTSTYIYDGVQCTTTTHSGPTVSIFKARILRKEEGANTVVPYGTFSESSRQDLPNARQSPFLTQALPSLVGEVNDSH